VFTYIDAQVPLHCHEHVAIIHRGEAPAAQATQFVREGLDRGQWCCFPASAARHAALRARLEDLGVDVERHLSGRTLRLPLPSSTAGDWLEGAKQFFAEAETAKIPAVRWLEEGVGAKPAAISVPQFFELHARLNYLVKQYPSVVLCLYDTERMEIPHLFSVIGVHRHLLVEGTLVRDNPFYIPAEKFLAMSPEDREHNLRDVFREVGFKLEKLLSTLAGYGHLQRPAPAGS
jgi:hypothetical protein